MNPVQRPNDTPTKRHIRELQEINCASFGYAVRKNFIYGAKMVTLPGIPSLAADVKSFSLSFWAGLYSGAIYSVFTGVFVGITVNWLQFRAHSRTKKANSENSKTRLLKRIMLTRHGAKIPVFGGLENAIPLRVLEFLRAVEIESLYEYERDIPCNEILIERLIVIWNLHQEYLIVSKSLEVFIKKIIHDVNRQFSVPESSDRTYRECIFGFCIGATQPEIYSAIPGLHDQIYRSSLEIYSPIRQHDILKNYQRIRAKLLVEYESCFALLKFYFSCRPGYFALELLD